MKEEILLKDTVIAIDSGSKDKNVLTKMRREKDGKLTVEKVWYFIKQLTQEEVNNLPDGARVVILWSGGNGPYEYEIAKFGNETFVYDFLEKINFGAGPVDFVGEKRFHTKVWLLEL